jgi:hypothetical protein
MTKTRLFSLLLTVAMTLSGVPAFAKIITFDFEQPGVFDSFSITNTTTQGVTFSPSCHIDWGNPVPDFYDSTWIGFDSFGCGNPLTKNPNYLGPDLNPASVFVFFENGPFSLRELVVALPTWKLTSSNGGFFDSDSVGIASEVNFAGPDWTDVSWILFFQDFEVEIAGETTTVRGYKVRVGYQPLPKSVQRTKHSLVAGVVAKALRRLGKGEERER